MKNLNKLRFLAMIVFTTWFAGCNTSDDIANLNDPSSVNFSTNFGPSTSRDFIGEVVTENNIPILGVTVSIGSSTVQTDANGIFIINNATVYEKFAFIKATKAGFIDGSRNLVPTTGKNSVKIMMVSNSPIQTVATGVTSTVLLSSGTQVKFDGAFQDAAGTAYSGLVSVSLYHLSASNSDMATIMPGSLYAQATDGSEKVLETFGMINVELRGASGQKLNIASGHNAEISLVIATGQMGTAPLSIPLWHFDETKGYWIQEGSAIKVGNKYVGNVSHFSWWNCDFPFDKATLTINVVNATANGVSNVRVDILAAGQVYPRTGISNTNGLITGIVPANIALTAVVYNACGSVISSNSIPPLSSNANYTFPNIIIPASSVTTLQGNLQKCNASNVTNGYVYLTAGGTNQVTPITNGVFNFSTLYCGSTSSNYTLIGYDYDNAQTTGTLTGIYTNPLTAVGNIFACNAVTQYITYQIDGGTVQNYYSGLTAGAQSNSIYISNSSGPAVGASFYLQSTTVAPGVYTTTDGFMLEGQFLIGTQLVNSSTPNTIIFNLSNFGTVGQYINVSFNGTYTVGSITHTITGSCHIIRGT